MSTHVHTPTKINVSVLASPDREGTASKTYLPLEQHDANDQQPPSSQPHRCARCNVRARTILWLLTFVGFAINYMIRININITITDMIVTRPRSTAERHFGRSPSECVPFESWSLDANNVSNLTPRRQRHEQQQPNETRSATVGSFTLERWLLDALHVPYARHGFDWDEHQQGIALGSFFWLHWLLQIPGGMLARRYGTKRVFGCANLIGCLLCAAMPLAAYLHYGTLIALRALQGLVCGVAWPAMHTMTGRWIPPNERSQFVTAYLGSSIGVAAFYPIFGLVIAASSWEWVYHVCTAVGIVWFVAWQWLVYDTPAQHPRICAEERAYIERALGASVTQPASGGKAPSTPWRAICTSRPVLVICVAQWGGVWGLLTLMTQAPTYFRTVHGWTVGVTGLLSGLPHLMRVAFAMAFSVLGDWLLRTERMSRTNVRKLAGTFSMLVGAGFVIGMAYAGCNESLALGMLVAATAVHGAVSSGPLASLVDLSPNYSGITLGLAGTVSLMPGFISPVIVGKLTKDNVSECVAITLGSYYKKEENNVGF